MKKRYSEFRHDNEYVDMRLGYTAAVNTLYQMPQLPVLYSRKSFIIQHVFHVKSRSSSVGIATRLWGGRSGF
jgi:hypothetical protein